MSDRPIQKGDLVMVVRGLPCCGEKAHLGRVYTVTGFFGGMHCTFCNQSTYMPSALLDGEYRALILSMLKRLDAPPLSEDVPAHEELTI